MGLPLARLTDVGTGTCCCHSSPTCIPMTGTVITSSPNVFGNNLGAARISDVVLGECGHTGVLVQGSIDVLTNNLPTSRLTDYFTGCFFGIIVSASPDICIGEGPTEYTEVDFGNLDDDPDTDDGYNTYPPIVGRPPTPEEAARSAAIDVSPTTTVSDNTDSPPLSAGVTPPVSCLTVTSSPVPETFQLSTNFKLLNLSTQTALSKYKVRAQAGFTEQQIVCNLQGWAENIGEPLLAKYPNLLITSGFRYGSGSSQHERGQAADNQFPNFTNQQYYDAAVWVRDSLQYDQLILEYGANRPWLHISFNRDGNRSSAASNKFGTRISPGNYVWRELRYMT